MRPTRLRHRETKRSRKTSPIVRHDAPRHDSMTLKAIGDRFGVGRERIRQIEARALDKLRAYCKARGLTFAKLLDLAPQVWASAPGPRSRLV
jgi:DNA-directed RNA polymerase sigma subunit (sigma70/sigma32)